MSSGGSVKHLGRNRFAVSFQLEDVQKPEQDLYRCVTQSSRGSGVSNFAELIVKGEELVFFLSFVLCVFVLLPIMRTSQDNEILAKSMSLYYFSIIALYSHILGSLFWNDQFCKTCVCVWTFICSLVFTQPHFVLTQKHLKSLHTQTQTPKRIKSSIK